MANFNQRPRVDVIAALLLILVLLVLIAVVVSTSPSLQRSLGIANEDMRTRMLNDPADGRLYRTIEQTYPDELRELVMNLSKLKAAGASSAEIDAAADAFDEAAASKHIAELLRAPHIRLVTLWNARLRLLEALVAQNTQQCAAWIQRSEIRDGHGDVAMRSLANAISIAGWQAAAAGRDHGVSRPKAPTEDDQRIHANAMRIEGLTDTEIRDMQTNGPSGATPATLCQWDILGVRALNRIPADQADRMFLSTLTDDPNEPGT